MKFLLAIVTSLFIGCSDKDPVEPPPLTPVAPFPPPESQVDKTFMDTTAVEAWRADVATYIRAEAAAPHPRDIWRYASDFKVDRSKPDPILGDPSVWDAVKAYYYSGTTYGLITDAPMPRPDEAVALEQQDKEWAAAQMWIILNRMDDAKRCGKALEEEGEWKAVAMIAAYTGDLEALDRATRRMVDGNQVTRTQEVAQYAFSQGKVDVAKHVAETHGWSLSEILSPFQIRELAQKGDASLLLETLKREIAVWDSDDPANICGLAEYQSPARIVADIAILGKTDTAKAREYAARYLKLPCANVFLWTRCGEGCFSDPVHGALELYQLIAQVKELRELYFAQLRQALDYMFPRLPHGDQSPTTTITVLDSDGYSGFGEEMWGYDRNIGGNYLYAYLQRVRKMGDRELTAFWVDMLDTFPQRSGWNDDHTLAFEREVGRHALGLPFFQSVGNISPTEVFVLEQLSGGAIRKMNDTWTAWDKELPMRERIEEVGYLFSFLTRGSVSASRRAAIRQELGIEVVPGEETDLRSELRARFHHSLDAHYGEAWMLKSKFGQVERALEINAKAQSERQARNLTPIDLYPDTDEELGELLGPSLTLLCEKLPAQCVRWTEAIVPVEAPAQQADPQPAPPVSTLTAAAVAQSMICTFVDAARPKVGDKFIIRCGDGATYLASGTYEVDHFVWSNLSPHTY